jgi:hypothetical protein
MKRRVTTMITTLALAGSLMLLATATAVADDREVPGCPSGPTLNAQTHQANVKPWELMSLDEFVAYLSTGRYTEEEAMGRAIITYDFCDKNDDDHACVMLQPLPGGTYWLAEDNHKAQGPRRS